MSLKGGAYGSASIGTRLCVSAVHTVRGTVHMCTAEYRHDYRLTDIHMSDM